MLYDQCVLRCTRNLPGLQQGTICIADYDSLTTESIHIFISPTVDSVTQHCLDNHSYTSWRRVILRKTAGFSQKYKRGSVRRTQYPLVNYVAMTCHRTMGDTFNELATQLSPTRGDEFSLWLVSQLYVLVSRVKHLRQLFFVGERDTTLSAIRAILSRRSMKEEQLYERQRQIYLANNSESGPGEIDAPLFMERYFEVPETPCGFVLVLVSTIDRTFRHKVVVQTDEALDSALRRFNSTEFQANREIAAGIPWAVGFFIWNFEEPEQRGQIYRLLMSLDSSDPLPYPAFLGSVQRALASLTHLRMCQCGRIVTSESN